MDQRAFFLREDLDVDASFALCFGNFMGLIIEPVGFKTFGAFNFWNMPCVLTSNPKG